MKKNGFSSVEFGKVTFVGMGLGGGIGTRGREMTLASLRGTKEHV